MAEVTYQPCICMEVLPILHPPQPCPVHGWATR